MENEAFVLACWGAQLLPHTVPASAQDVPFLPALPDLTIFVVSWIVGTSVEDLGVKTYTAFSTESSLGVEFLPGVIIVVAIPSWLLATRILTFEAFEVRPHTQGSADCLFEQLSLFAIDAHWSASRVFSRWLVVHCIKGLLVLVAWRSAALPGGLAIAGIHFTWPATNIHWF